MSEENKIVELKDEELEKVNGGFIGQSCESEYNNSPGLWFDNGTKVEEDNGVQYIILRFNSEEDGGTINGTKTRWFDAECTYIPAFLINNGFNYWTLHQVYQVNSSFVHKVQ